MNPDRPIRLAEITDAVVAETGVEKSLLYSRNRTGPAVYAKELAVWCTRAWTEFSYPEIASFFRGRYAGHSTYIYMHQRAAERYAEGGEFRRKVEAVRARIDALRTRCVGLDGDAYTLRTVPDMRQQRACNKTGPT